MKIGTKFGVSGGDIVCYRKKDDLFTLSPRSY